MKFIFSTPTSKKAKTIVRSLSASSLLTIGCLSIYISKKTWFPGNSYLEFLDAIHDKVNLFFWWAAAFLGMTLLIIGIFNGRRIHITLEHAIEKIIYYASSIVLPFSLWPIALLLSVIAFYLGVQLYDLPQCILPNSDIILNSNQNEYYIADRDSSRIFIMNRYTRRIRKKIDLSLNGSIGHIAIAPKRHEIYVSDIKNKSITVVDIIKQKKVNSIPLPAAAGGWMVVSPDEKTLYVSYERGAYPQGRIDIIDLSEQRIIRSINGVNCPESIAITLDGKYLYAASQCGGGQDPLFVIDVKTGAVVQQIQDCAVGRFVAISPNGEKAYVSSGVAEYLRCTCDRIVVIDIKQNIIQQTIPVDAFAFAFTPDGKYLLAPTPKDLVIIRTIDDKIINIKKNVFTSIPRGITVSGDGHAIVLLDKDTVLEIGLNDIL